MSETESGQERTEDATPEKLRKSREEGQVPRSRELMSVSLVTVGALALMAIFPGASTELANFSTRLFQSAGDPDMTMGTVLRQAAWVCMWAVLPFLLLLFAAGFIGSASVGGVNWSNKAMSFKASRLSPMKGFKRMFSSNSSMELGKAILKITLLGSVTTVFLSITLEPLLQLIYMPMHAAMAEGVGKVALALLCLGAVLIVVAVIDVPFQVAQNLKQIKMTKQEVKDEHKNSEGKPEVKQRVRQVQQEIANRRMLDDVPEATVVITNPEHYAVALTYDAQSSAPIVVALGVDSVAFRIQEVARNHDVLVLRSPPLTRAIYHSTKLGEEIPLGLYGPVAQVLAYVAQLSNYQNGLLPAAPTLGPVQVPKDFQVDPK